MSASKPVTREGDKTTGHGPFPPRPTKGPGVGSSTDVFVNNKGVNRKGDEWQPHGRPSGLHASSGDYKHITEAGSASVFVNNQPIARIGDSVDRDGDAIAAGSANVFAGDSVPFVIPPVVIPPDVQAAADRQTAAYVANPSRFKVSSNDQVKSFYAGPPTQPASVGVSLIDTSAAASDINSFLKQIVSEASRGVWDETGMGGKPSNPNIIKIWKDLGYPQTGAWTTDQTAWCMGLLTMC